MADNLLQLVLGKPGLVSCSRHSVAVARMGLSKRCDRLLDLVGAETDLCGKVLDLRVVGYLIEDSVQEAHRGSPSQGTRTGHLACQNGSATIEGAKQAKTFQARMLAGMLSFASCLSSKPSASLTVQVLEA